MPKGRADIANTALRVFLWRVGMTYDVMRGLTPYGGKRDKRKVLDYFAGTCCYCEVALGPDNTSEDHLVGANKDAMGLHAWGNLVPACRECNGKKQQHDWLKFLRSVSTTEDDFTRRVSKIEGFQKTYGYAPGIGLKIVAETLYEEVGALAMMLVDLKIKRAEELIAQLGKTDPPGDSA